MGQLKLKKKGMCVFIIPDRAARGPVGFCYSLVDPNKMKVSYPGTKLALAFRLVHFIALGNNYKHVLFLLEPIILQLRPRGLGR